MSEETGPGGQQSPQAVLEEANIITFADGEMRLTAEFEAAMGVYHDSYIDLDERAYQQSVAEAFAIDPDEVAGQIDHFGVTREQFVAYLAISAQLGRDTPVTARAEMAMLVTESAPSTPVPAGLVELDDAGYASFLQQHPRAAVVVWKRFCEPCDRMKQDLDPVGTAFPPAVVVAGVDGEAAPAFRRQFSVDAAPSVLLFDDGDCQLTLAGYHSAEQIATACAEVYGTG